MKNIWLWIIGSLLAVWIFGALAGSNSSTPATQVNGLKSTPTKTEQVSPSSNKNNSWSIPQEQENTLSNDNYYTNINGDEVHSPAYSQDNTIPDGASAICADGTYSFSQNHRGTCSHHGGVENWL